MAYVGWAKNVNKVIIDSTSVNIGDKAVVEDDLEIGKKKRRVKMSNVPDTFEVTMDFDWFQKDSKGLTEKDRFLQWYKNVHRYGCNPFEFPSICAGSGSPVGTNEWYRITSGIKGQKSGLCMRVTMTWETVYNGVIKVSAPTMEIDHIEAFADHCNVILKAQPPIEPTSQTWQLQIFKSSNPITVIPNRFYYDDYRTAIIYYPEITEKGNYTVNIDDNMSDFIVE